MLRKTISALLIPALGCCAAPGAGPRVVKTIDRDWTFQYIPSPVPDDSPAAPGYDDSRWPAVALPHTWSTYETTGGVHPFIKAASERTDTYWWYGWGWYRKRFVIGREDASRLVSAEFDGVQKYARVYLNGKRVGEHKGGYTSFSVDLTPRVRFGAENLLAVEVSNRRDDRFGGIPPMTAGNFDVYGGIYRDVRLVIRDRLHVPFQGSAAHEGGTFVTTPSVSASSAAVNVRTWVRNDYPVVRACALTTVIRDEDGGVVAEATVRAPIAPGTTREFSQDLGPVVRPRLWSPDAPYLYRVDTEVRDGERLADTYRSPLGIRWFRWDHASRRLLLNGRPILLRGINRHQEFPWLGDAMPKWMHRRDLEDIRFGLGLNFQRTAHYPQDPYVYDLCDRLGFMLIEEEPNIKDCPFGRDIQRQDLVEAIRRDRNHPSILIWSMGNETDRPADSAWAAAEDRTRIIYLRQGENGGPDVQLTDADLPIENYLRCTVRGWYDRDDHGFGKYGPNPLSAQVTGTEEWQYRRDRAAPQLLDGNMVVFVYADHGADRNYVNCPLRNLNPKGWVDAYRFPKFVYYLWQANYTSKPMVFIHPTYWRPRYIGRRCTILVDSNCDEVELTLDGRRLGVGRPSDANRHSLAFPDVRVSRGTLVAEGVRDGRSVRCVLPMAGPAARLVLSAGPAAVPADRSGISVVSVDVVDASGAHVYGASPPLSWSISGPGTLVGPAEYRTDTAKRNAAAGEMYIDAPVANLVRSTDVPGIIRVRVTAPGLEPAEATIAAVPPPDDSVPGIVEPPLSDAGRSRVARDPGFRAAAAPAKEAPLAEISADLDLRASSPGGYRARITAFIRGHNPGADTASGDFLALVDRLASLAALHGGRLIADDYNFHIRMYNDSHPSGERQHASRN